jgi:hypothetical protein
MSSIELKRYSVYMYGYMHVLAGKGSRLKTAAALYDYSP